MNRSVVVLIAGGTGSGKSTLAKRIKKKDPDRITIVSLDNYYKDQGHLSEEARASLNYDSPEVLDFATLIQNVKELKRGNDIIEPRYDFQSHTRKQNSEATFSKPVIIVEGILSLFDAEVRKLSDLNLYVDIDDDERILRRILRDVDERGRTVDGVVQQYRNSVKPMHALNVAPTRKFADFIVQDNGTRTVDYLYDLICTLLR